MKPFIPKRPGFCIILYFLLIHMRLLPQSNLKKNMRMKRILIFLFSFPLILFPESPGQYTLIPKIPALEIYRASFPHINDLVHTKLDVRFDYSKSYMYGKAWITLQTSFLSDRFPVTRCQRNGYKRSFPDQREPAQPAKI